MVRLRPRRQLEPEAQRKLASALWYLAARMTPRESPGARLTVVDRGNVVRFHFLAFYPDGVEPLPERETGSSLRIGSTIEVEVQPDSDLLRQVRDAVDADPVLGPRLSAALATGHFRIFPLSDGVTAEQWNSRDPDDPGGAEEIRWIIDPVFKTVVRVDAIRRPATLSLRQLDELVELGYLQGDTRELLVLIDGGLGGGEASQGLIEWLYTHGVDVGIGFVGEQVLRYLWESVTRRIRGSVRDRRAKRVAAMWDRNNFYRPVELREFVEAREVWDAPELGRSLALSPKAAEQLLRSLGFEPSQSKRWRLSRGWRAQRRRGAWLVDEDDQIAFARGLNLS